MEKTAADAHKAAAPSCRRGSVLTRVARLDSVKSRGECGYSIVRQFAVPALSRTNSFLLSPEQINTPLTSTQPGEQPRGAALRTHKHYESETPRGLSYVTRPRSSQTDGVCSLHTEPRPGRKRPSLFLNFGSGAEPVRPTGLSFVTGGDLLLLLLVVVGFFCLSNKQISASNKNTGKETEQDVTSRRGHVTGR